MNKNSEKMYLLHSGVTSFSFSLVFSVTSIYYIEKIGLNPFQLVIVGTVLELFYFLFEVPTGVVADVYSRKLSIIIGLALTGLGFIIEGFIPYFFAVIISQFFWGVGATFLSGAVEAWIADEVGVDKLQNLFLTGAQVNQLASFLGIIASVFLGLIAINLPIYIGGIIFIILAFHHIAFMKENTFKPLEKKNHQTWSTLYSTFNKGIKFIKGKKILISAITITLFYGLYSEGIDRLWNVHFLKDITLPVAYNLKPVVWFGIINAGSMLLMIFVTSKIKNALLYNKEVHKINILIILNALLTISIIWFGLSRDFYTAVLAIWSIKIIRKVNRPIFNAFINQYIESGVRATVLSTISQFDALGQILGGPVIGLIALKVSISVAILITAVILLPVVIILMFNKRKRLL